MNIVKEGKREWKISLNFRNRILHYTMTANIHENSIFCFYEWSSFIIQSVRISIILAKLVLKN